MKKVKNSYQYLLPTFTLLIIELFVTWIIFILLLTGFLLVSNKSMVYKPAEFDFNVADWIDTITTRRLTDFMDQISFLASKEIILTSCLVLFLYFLFVKRHDWYSVKIPVLSIGCIALNYAFIHFPGKTRPGLTRYAETNELSFQNSEAMVCFVFFALLMYVSWTSIGSRPVKLFITSVLLVCMNLVGFSKVYQKVELASDVMAGFVLGGIWIVLSIVLLSILEIFAAKSIDSN